MMTQKQWCREAARLHDARRAADAIIHVFEIGNNLSQKVNRSTTAPIPSASEAITGTQRQKTIDSQSMKRKLSYLTEANRATLQVRVALTGMSSSSTSAAEPEVARSDGCCDPAPANSTPQFADFFSFAAADMSGGAAHMHEVTTALQVEKA
jgi:hypothetical protein